MNSSTIRCVVTAGPTREHLDPVRYFSNGSSGRMGYSLAAAARDLGWKTQLISGPVALRVPEGLDCRGVISAAQMREAVSAAFDSCDVLIMCAAVADYRPVSFASGKMKKQPENLVVEMEPTPDILAEMGRRKQQQCLVGFAAETGDLVRRAREKLERKNLDWIVANAVGGDRGAIDSEHNTVLMLGRRGDRLEFGPAPKPEVARFILQVLNRKISHG